MDRVQNLGKGVKGATKGVTKGVKNVGKGAVKGTLKPIHVPFRRLLPHTFAVDPSFPTPALDGVELCCHCGNGPQNPLSKSCLTCFS